MLYYLTTEEVNVMAILIVVANATVACFFSAEPLNANASLIELEDKVHPSSRLHGRDLETLQSSGSD